MRLKFLLLIVVLTCGATLGLAQTKVSVPKNKYTVEQDVQLGKEAAAEVRKQLPMMNDSTVTPYIAALGRRLVTAIPPELQQRSFQYTFETVNVREINAFALPGGPMFVHRGMIEAARSEGEVAGVMAHEISHVILRHGTAQATKAQGFSLLQLGGAIAGAVIGGTPGAIVAQGTQFGVGTYFMKYGRAYEKDADILGAQMMARVGYDPREMANMFQTIEKEGGSGGPEWLSDHPNPGNRSKYIQDEAAKLRIERANNDPAAFNRVIAHLRTLPRAPTTEQATAEAARGGGRTGSGRTSSGSNATLPPVSARVEAPSGRYTRYNEGEVFVVSVPSNWREIPSANNVTFAPPGGYGDHEGQSVFTYGVELGLSRHAGHDLRTATGELVEALRQGNPRMGRPSSYRTVTVDGRSALETSMSNVSDVTGETEVVQLVTSTLRDGTMFHFIAVAPQGDLRVYQPVFNRVIGSVRLLQ